MFTLEQFGETSSAASHTVVLLHAFPLDRSMWHNTARGLIAKLPGVRIILPNTYGAEGLAASESWTMQRFAEYLQDALRSIGIMRCVLGGCSMGGYQALAFAARFSDSVAGLILSNTKSTADSPEAARDRIAFADELGTRGSIVAVERVLPKALVGQSVYEEAERRSLLEAMILRQDPHSLAEALLAMEARHDTTAVLRSLKVPVLAIAGGADAIIDASELVHVSAAARNSTLHIMPGAGHLAPFDQPEPWATIVAEFIAGCGK